MVRRVPTPPLPRALRRLVKEGIRSTVAAEVLGLVRHAIDGHREVAVALVQDRSRWWIASVVDRRIADTVVDGVLSLLDELRTEDSDLRRGFEAAFDRLVDRLVAEGVLTQAVAEGRRHIVESGTLGNVVLRLAGGLRDRLRDLSPRTPKLWPPRSPG